MDLSPAAADTLRPLLFFGLLLLLAYLERLRPQRLSDPQRPIRWASNFGMVALGTLLLMALPLSAIAVARWAAESGFGLFNQAEAPRAVEIALSLLLLDLALYAQHRAFHELRWLWPLHRVHHSDVEFDVTTALRFHPGELLLSQLYKFAVISLLGAPWIAVLAYEILLSSGNLWTHANLRLAPAMEQRVRLLLATPDMHRVHHSVYRDETDSNYGSVLSLWDRLFRSFRLHPRDGHRQMRIGLLQYRHPEQQAFGALLWQPLRG